MPKRGFAILACAALAAATGAAIPAPELGDPESGAEIFRQCRSCHSVGPGAVNRVGPQLNGLFGRRAGSLIGYRYSDDLVREGRGGLYWSVETLHVYLENPRALVSQTRMNFAGIADARERADLLAFLRLYSDNPRDIPEAPPTASHADPELTPELHALAGDPEYGAYLASECLTCHRADGADAGIPSITGWPVADFKAALNAYRMKARPHPVMRMLAANLTDEEIAALAAYFAALGQ